LSTIVVVGGVPTASVADGVTSVVGAVVTRARGMVVVEGTLLTVILNGSVVVVVDSGTREVEVVDVLVVVDVVEVEVGGCVAVVVGLSSVVVVTYTVVVVDGCPCSSSVVVGRHVVEVDVAGGRWWWPSSDDACTVTAIKAIASIVAATSTRAVLRRFMAES
jgi:hypothetical protein